MSSVKVIQASQNKYTGKKIATLELEYPRMIHSELMTHRMLSRNASSSRAIPIKAMLEQVRTNTAYPVSFGKNQVGMQASENLTGKQLESAELLWKATASVAAYYSECMQEEGIHKQVANRITEPYQHIKVVVTATEWDNFLWLRNHKAADPTFEELAAKIAVALKEADYIDLQYGEWHVPYIERRVSGEDTMTYYSGFDEVTVEQAKMISASCCAQVSYRKLDNSLEKAISISNMLLKDDRLHASPFEHQAMCFDYDANYSDGCSYAVESPQLWPEGVTGMNRNLELCSGNFVGWIQHRHLIKGNT